MSTDFEQAFEFANLVRRSNEIWDDISTANIAKVTGVSERRARKLLQDIERYKIATFEPSINYLKLKMFIVFTALKVRHPRYNEGILDALAQTKYVERVYLLSGGDATHLIKARLPSFEKIKNLLKAPTLKNLDEKLRWKRTMIVGDHFLEDGVLYTQAIKDAAPAELDGIDYQILAELKNDAHQPLRELGKKINLSAPAIYKRIEKMKEGGVIMGYMFPKKWSNISNQSWPVKAICSINPKHGCEEKVGLQLAKIKRKNTWINSVYLIYGDYDIACSIETPDIKTFKDFVATELISKDIVGIRPYIVMDWRGRNWLADFCEGG